MDNIVCCRCYVNQIIQFRRCIFSNFIIFCHLKLEIALAIPASNDKKYLIYIFFKQTILSIPLHPVIYYLVENMLETVRA